MATTNYSYNSNQHKMMQQQQTTTGTDNDEAATNCSETMSTTNEDEECFGPAQPPPSSAQPANQLQAASTSSGPGWTLSGERLGPQGESESALAGDIQQSDNNNDDDMSVQANSEEQPTEHLAISTQETTDEACSGRSELSLASGATQAPPSYGTATRNCAPLDVGQLRDQTQVQHLQQQKQGPPPPACSDAFRFGSPASQHYSLGLLVANQHQHLQQQPLSATANHYSNANSVQIHQPLFNGITIADGYNQGVSLTMRVPQTKSFESQTWARNATVGQQDPQQQTTDSHLLDDSGSHLPRSSFMAPYLNGPGPTNIDGYSLATAGGQQNARPDNDQRSELSWLKLQQQQVANFKPVPINHVISAHGSFQWQPHCYAPGSSSLTKGSSTAGSTDPTPVGQRQQQQVAPLAALGRATRKSGIMDAPFPWPTTVAAAASLDRQHHRPALATNRNEPGGPLSWPQGMVPGSISGGATTNVGGAVTQQFQEPPHDNQDDGTSNNNQRTFSLRLHQASYSNNNNIRQMMLSKGSPSRRSDENLERTSRRQQQQAHRKRRRHKSTSGRSVSPPDNGQVACNENEESVNARFAWQKPTPPLPPPQSVKGLSDATTSINSKPKPNSKQTISAHCWLIDSSDDQIYGPSGDSRKSMAASSSSAKGRCAENSLQQQHVVLKPTQTHLTVAMMKQTLEQQRMKQQQQACGQSGPSRLKSNQYASSKSSTPQLAQLKPTVSTVCDGVDLTVSLRTNSLRMERILNRESTSSRHTRQILMAGRAGSRTMPARRQLQQKQRNRRHLSSSSSSTSSLSCNAVTTSSSNNRLSVGKTARLSYLFSLMTNLVRRAPRSSGIRPPVAPIVEPQSDEYYPPAPPANSISGSVLAKSGQSLAAPYTACGSLAISSSSSTSAYATESSHLSSANSNPSRHLVAHLNATATDRPISLALFKGQAGHQTQSQVPPSSASTAGSSLFYSSSGNSGIQMSTGGSHSYEYCDDDRIMNETKFVQEQAQTINEKQTIRKMEEVSSLSSRSTQSSSNEKNDEEDSIQDLENGSVARASGFKAPRRANMTMSDNELLSAGSEAGFHGDGGTTTTAAATLANAVSQATPSTARRRWWWISLKDVLCRRPCGRRPGSSMAADSEEGALEPVQRYKSLRSRRQAPSTLKNVLSLAKADRVFRTRLLTSLLVSCILLGLIGLLCGLIYSRSTAIYQRNRLGLLIDDSDYDLSWLWPYDNSIGPQLQQSTPTSPRYRMPETQLPRNPAEQLMMDGILRGPLLMIEQSERLAQYQQTMVHLTNIQLANDNFIDLTQLASRLAPGVNEPPPPSNSTPESPTRLRPNLQQLSDSERDLISLTLLSNLHWPLVKWRHQNQRSVANFLSFAVPSAGAVQPHLRSLLSVLLLAEASPDLPFAASNNSNLMQFARLNSLLRSSSYQITSCTNHLTTEPLDGPARASLRTGFCEQLVARYRRMMFTLSRLNHSHLVKLRDSMEPPPTIMDSMSSNGPDINQHETQFAPSRTLLSFFLDRLALLDVQTLAESTLATAGFESGDLEESFVASDDEDNSSSSGTISWESKALASILALELPSDSTTTKSDAYKWHQTGSLLELAKLTIGDGPTRLNVDSEHNEWVAHLQHLEAENNEAWRELLSRDLLYPWPSPKLPRFLAPLNYDLFLHPNVTSRLVLGMVKIGFKLERPTRFIVMHCDKLNLVDVSLWLKHEPLGVSRNPSNGTSSSSSSTLNRISIRRVLRLPKLEQIYIELQHQVNPSRAPEMIRTSGQASHTTGSLNFGGELPLQEVARSESLFILSISFNKTSLMIEPNNYDSTPADANVQEHGLEFVQYADYFAQSEAELKTILYTQFEPQNARRLFPCLDEPHFRAKFQLNLVHEQGHQVLFNAPKRERVPYTADGAHQMSVFEATPIPLSTYLVAFIVCDTQNIKSITSRVAQLRPATSSEPGGGGPKSEPKHIQVQVLAQFEQLGQAEFASQLVPQLLAFYQSHLNFPYPMDKLDLVAIPSPRPLAIAPTRQPIGLINQQAQQPPISQQRLNTMENMGLIWFKANLLLVDTNLISQNLIEQVAMIISHQLAHQYFGNIVSISQWDDLWLYESLCQYLESVALSSVQPDWRLEEQFVVTSIQDTLALEQFNWPLQQQQSSSGTEQLTLGAQNSEQLIKESSERGADIYEDAELEGADLSSGQGMPELGALSSGPSSPEPLDKVSRITSSRQELRGSGEFRRSSAILHMLLFNLLPSQEARARLLRRCLSLFRYGTMSRAQFWRQFGEQLSQQGSSERLALALDLLAKPIESGGGSNLPDSFTQLSYQSDKWHNFTTAADLPSSISDQATVSPSERVVFVRPAATSGLRAQDDEMISLTADTHKIHVRSADRLSHNLELTVSAWLERRGYPLITASMNRDRIQLKQERFSFAWWNEPGLMDDEPIGLPDALRAEPNSAIGQRSKRWASGDSLEAGPIWPIPLMLMSRVNQKQVRFLWMDKREMEIPLQEVSYTNHETHSEFLTELRKGGHSNIWFKLNVNQSSLVRVNYDERNWEALTDLMLKSHYSNHLLSPLDRANLIDDSFTLMRCGKLSVGIAMNLTLYLEVGEREFMPWTSALRHLDQMQTLLNQNPLWHRYVLKLMQPISSVIGWKDDGPHLMRKLRRNLFSVALQYGDERTVNKAKQEFKGWFKSGRFIVPNLQELVYVAGVRYGDQQEWFHCWQKYTQLVVLELGSSSQNQTAENSPLDAGGSARDHGKSSPLLASVTGPIGSMQELNEPNAENEKRQLLTALASTHNTWLLEQFLNYSLDSTKIQPHHLKHVMQTLGKNPVARLYLWRFVRLNWNSLVDRYIDNSFEAPTSSRSSGNDRIKSLRDTDYHQVLATMIMESTKHFVTKLDYDEVKTFFEVKRKQHKQRLDASGWSSSLEGAIQQSLQVIRANIYWRNYIEPKLTKWLSHYDSSIIN